MTPATWGRRVLNGTEEGLHGCEIWDALVAVAGDELVKEGGSSVKEKREGTEVEVGVLCDRVVVPVAAVLGEGLTIELSTGGGVGDRLHLCEQSAVEAVVVSVGKEEVVACERRIGLELVVAIKTGLAAQKRECGSARRGIASDTETSGEHITTSFNTEDSEEDGKVVSYVVDILLGVDQLLEVGNTIV